jgi:DNA-directed RNA polymerase subunit K/omega
MIDTTESRVAYTSQTAAQACGNLYLLPVIAAARYRELRDGHPRRVKTDAGGKVTALQEIEAGVFAFQKVIK